MEMNDEEKWRRESVRKESEIEGRVRIERKTEEGEEEDNQKMMMTEETMLGIFGKWLKAA